MTSPVRLKLERHILDYGSKNGVTILALNVQPEHVHCLVNLAPSQRIEDVVKLCKGESAHWINGENLLAGKFSWQAGYGAFSVSPSHAESAMKYIAGQNEHHRSKSFEEEYKAFLTKYGFKNIDPV